MRGQWEQNNWGMVMGNYQTDSCEGNGWGMGEWDGNNEIITEP
jgi:hypothetical protein